jgi:hypothetical protein
MNVVIRKSSGMMMVDGGCTQVCLENTVVDAMMVNKVRKCETPLRTGLDTLDVRKKRGKLQLF